MGSSSDEPRLISNERLSACIPSSDFPCSVQKVAKKHHELELIGKTSKARRLPVGLVCFALIEQHAPVHPIRLRQNGIEVATAAKGGFGKVCEPGIVIYISQMLPHDRGVGSQHRSFPQHRKRFGVLTFFAEHYSEPEVGLERARIQGNRLAGSLFRQRELRAPFS